MKNAIIERYELYRLLGIVISDLDLLEDLSEQNVTFDYALLHQYAYVIRMIKINGEYYPERIDTPICGRDIIIENGPVPSYVLYRIHEMEEDTAAVSSSSYTAVKRRINKMRKYY